MDIQWLIGLNGIRKLNKERVMNERRNTKKFNDLFDLVENIGEDVRSIKQSNEEVLKPKINNLENVCYGDGDKDGLVREHETVKAKISDMDKRQDRFDYKFWAVVIALIGVILEVAFKK